IPIVILIVISFFISIMPLSASLSECTHTSTAKLVTALLVVHFLRIAELVVLVAQLPQLSLQVVHRQLLPVHRVYTLNSWYTLTQTCDVSTDAPTALSNKIRACFLEGVSLCCPRS